MRSAEMFTRGAEKVSRCVVRTRYCAERLRVPPESVTW